MKRAALLLRCSTDAQDYERQKLDLLDTIKGMGYTTSDDLVFGQYITGKDDVRKKDRESVAECKQAVREGKVDAIFINEVSRLSRDSIAGRLFIREFNDEYKYLSILEIWECGLLTLPLEQQTGHLKQCQAFILIWHRMNLNL